MELFLNRWILIRKLGWAVFRRHCYSLAAEVLFVGDYVGSRAPKDQGSWDTRTMTHFYALVDDSTVFLQEAKSLPRIQDIVAAFEQT